MAGFLEIFLQMSTVAKGPVDEILYMMIWDHKKDFSPLWDSAKMAYWQSSAKYRGQIFTIFSGSVDYVEGSTVCLWR